MHTHRQHRIRPGIYWSDGVCLTNQTEWTLGDGRQGLNNHTASPWAVRAQTSQQHLKGRCALLFQWPPYTGCHRDRKKDGGVTTSLLSMLRPSVATLQLIISGSRFSVHNNVIHSSCCSWRLRRSPLQAMETVQSTVTEGNDRLLCSITIQYLHCFKDFRWAFRSWN